MGTNEYYILTPEDVMEELCIGRNAIYKLLDSGELKGFRVGRNPDGSQKKTLCLR